MEGKRGQVGREHGPREKRREKGHCAEIAAAAESHFWTTRYFFEPYSIFLRCNTERQRATYEILVLPFCVLLYGLFGSGLVCTRKESWKRRHIVSKSPPNDMDIIKESIGHTMNANSDHKAAETRPKSLNPDYLLKLRDVTNQAPNSKPYPPKGLQNHQSATYFLHLQQREVFE